MDETNSAFIRLRNAIIELFVVMAEELGLNRLMDWLAKRLNNA